MTEEPLKPIVDALKGSPLFQLSLSSKELFHSNFLAWICETYPELAGWFFARFLNHPPSCDSSLKDLKVYREHKNIDLWLQYPNGEQLIIENKVKSLPRLSQLQEYADKILNPKNTPSQPRNRTKGSNSIPDKPQTSFLLLSLTWPAFLGADETTIPLENEVKWRYLSYYELAGNLDSLVPVIGKIDHYHGQILRDYIDFIRNLDKIQEHCVANWDDHKNFWDISDDMRKIRLHDLIDKLRYAELARRVEKIIGTNFSKIHSDYREFWKGNEGEVLVTSGMTRGVGLFDFKYLLMDSQRPHCGNPIVLGLGVQVQGNNFRLFVEASDKQKSREIAVALLQSYNENQVWFNFKILNTLLAFSDSTESIEYPKKRSDFNNYSKQFYYRSKRLGNMSPQKLVEAIVAYVRLIQDNETILRQQIEAILQNADVTTT